MLKKLLKNRNISIYRLSEMSKVPYTTLNELVNGKKKIENCKIKTVENIANSLNMSIDALLHILNNKKVVLSNSWEDAKNHTYYFPIIVKNDNYECNRIHPLKQAKVNELYNIMKNNEKIEKIIIFGSSVNIRCNIKSDLDIAIKLKSSEFNRENQNNISEEIQEHLDYGCDIIWLNQIDKTTQLYSNIINRGVTIYE